MLLLLLSLKQTLQQTQVTLSQQLRTGSQMPGLVLVTSTIFSRICPHDSNSHRCTFEQQWYSSVGTILYLGIFLNVRIDPIFVKILKRIILGGWQNQISQT